MPVFTAPDFDDHERLVFCRDTESDLHAIIALHSTALGPAIGGCRMWTYENEPDAVSDVLRLSRGMSYKNAIAELPLGGGKTVIIGDSRKIKTEKLLRALGKHIEQLAGDYIAGQDIGMGVNDMEIIANETQFVCGQPNKLGQAGGNPSPKTAYGIYIGILATVGFQTNDVERRDLKGIRIAIQGVGEVGYHLCQYLHQAGAELFVSDVDKNRVDAACAEFHATPVTAERILFQDVDVLSPCALGAVLNHETISGIKAPAIVGGANNQLAENDAGQLLAERDILYAPDYVVNAGGVINLAYEYLRLGDEKDVKGQIEKIGPRLINIFQLARNKNLPTSEIADQLAQQRIESQTSKSKLPEPVQAA